MMIPKKSKRGIDHPISIPHLLTLEASAQLFSEGRPLCPMKKPMEASMEYGGEFSGTGLQKEGEKLCTVCTLATASGCIAAFGLVL
jgi:hypothetical protein